LLKNKMGTRHRWHCDNSSFCFSGWSLITRTWINFGPSGYPKGKIPSKNESLSTVEKGLCMKMLRGKTCGISPKLIHNSTLLTRTFLGGWIDKKSL
jgi:hypothetical protein